MLLCEEEKFQERTILMQYAAEWNPDQRNRKDGAAGDKTP